ncbi:hypothetical protein EKO04_006563 [Ascochyta lentis]|uniref:RING-type domain-containing protein n=1 Tax=Ascochyta lentis TaxID=205686 RepID=A0A8H7J281_9PLEO|nr:hypothetical protein EKO04_006563 [Ascochyta lentis]
MPLFEPVYLSANVSNWFISQVPWYFLLPESGECPICAENFCKATVMTICGHVFHFQCLMDWFQSIGSFSTYNNYECTCPMCRKVLARVSPSPHEEVEQYYEESEEDSESVNSEEDATNLAETSSNNTDREETDHLARMLRDEAEQELQCEQLQLQNLLDILYEDEESLNPPPTMYGGSISHEAGFGGETQEYTWSATTGSFIPTRLLPSREQINEDNMKRQRRMYRTRVQISDAEEKIEKLTARLGNRGVQV